MSSYVMKPCLKWWINMNVEQVEAAFAVSEAAKALGIIRLLADARDGRDFTTEQCRALRDFEGAVAALQEVEGGNA